MSELKKLIYAATDLPWEYKDVSVAGKQIYGIVPFKANCAEYVLKEGSQPIYTLLAYETWIQFEPKDWEQMQEAKAELIVHLVNNAEKYDAMERQLSLAKNQIRGCCSYII